MEWELQVPCMGLDLYVYMRGSDLTLLLSLCAQHILSQAFGGIQCRDVGESLFCQAGVTPQLLQVYLNPF